MDNIVFKKARLSDIENMQKLVEPEIKNGIILPRSDDEVATNIRSYTLAFFDGDVVGFSALHIHTVELAEIRSLVVKESLRGKKIGEGIVKKLLEEAKSLDVKKVLALTYKADFFKRLGFEEISKESLPEHKVWADCIKCQHFPVCNEVSLIKKL